MYPFDVLIGSDEGIDENYRQLLDKVPVLRQRTGIRELSGGLTNRNLAIDTPSGKYVARISSNTSAMLAINRESEYQNSKIAASVGVGAPVHDYIPGQGLLVLGYIDGQTFGSEDVANNLGRIAESCRILHGAKPFVSDFNMFDIQRQYLQTVRGHGYRLPDEYVSYLPRVKQMELALEVLDEGTVPCNNDLLPANFIDDGKKIWIIDYEYSGNNDACFELGNIWSEASLEYDCLVELVDAYYDRHRPEKIARAWFLALMSKYGWTLWASIQQSISTFDFDFWQWGMENYDRARSDFESQKFDEMLDLVARRSD